MSKKRSIILISIITVIMIVFIIFSTIFRVNGQVVVFAEETNSFSAEQIIKSGEIKKGKSVFFINKKSTIDKIEKAVPYVKVNKVETKFPNKIIYYVEKRNNLTYIEKNGEFYILDEYLKVLNKTTDKPNLIALRNVDFNYNMGDFLENNFLKSVFGMFNKQYQITKDGVMGPMFSMSNPIAILKIDSIDYNGSENSIIVKSYQGFSLKIVNDVNITNKVIALMGIIMNNQTAMFLSEEERLSNDVFEIKSTSNGLVLTNLSKNS